jgi:predicted AlkP superfamily pyrophosphatase or phosphodiesterase
VGGTERNHKFRILSFYALHSIKAIQMRSLLILVVLQLSFFAGVSQGQPKLIVGIVVDQMRQDYLYRYWDKFEDDGFKRLINNGYYCRNVHFNYIPTYTAPGHASIFTGTTPMVNGIISNYWYDRDVDGNLYCVGDDNVNSVGTDNANGKMSPHRLLTTTLGDAVRQSNQFKGKSIGVSIKDRAAILPAGHSANAAYWMDYQSGNMITSTYYMTDLPKWVKSFNAKKIPDELVKMNWELSLAPELYIESTADNSPYEKALIEGRDPIFPYDVKQSIAQRGYYAFASTPYGNTYVRKFAEDVIINEDLGQDDHLDFLSISFSSPDMIGHSYGPQSMEIEDTYLKLDKEIALLLKALDQRVGVGNYSLFLTADHAAAPIPKYMSDNKIPVDYIDDEKFETELKAELELLFPSALLISNYSNQQVFVNHEELDKKGLESKKVHAVIKNFALNYPGVSNALDIKDLQHPLPPDQFSKLAAQGWNPQRSGDIIIQYLPGWMEYEGKGTTHGSSYAYDTHVPLIFFGWGVTKGETIEEIQITQIAPTMSILCRIGFPDASSHAPIIFK